MNNNKVKDDINSTNKEIIAKLRKAQADFTEVGVRNALNDLLMTDAVVHMPYPFGDLVGPDDFFDTCYVPCLLYTSPSPRDGLLARMPSSA